MKRGAEITEARLEAALLQAANIVDEHGEGYRPLYDRLERELMDSRSNDPLVRARSLLRNNSAGTAHGQHA